MRFVIAFVLASGLLVDTPARANLLVGHPQRSSASRSDTFTCGGNQVVYEVIGRSAWAYVRFEYTLHQEFTSFEVMGPSFYSFDWGPPVPGGMWFKFGDDLLPGLYSGKLTVFSYEGLPPCVYTTRFAVL